MVHNSNYISYICGRHLSTTTLRTKNTEKNKDHEKGNQIQPFVP